MLIKMWNNGVLNKEKLLFQLKFIIFVDSWHRLHKHFIKSLKDRHIGLPFLTSEYRHLPLQKMPPLLVLLLLLPLPLLLLLLLLENNPLKLKVKLNVNTVICFIYASKSYCNRALYWKNKTNLISIQSELNQYCFNCDFLLKQVKHLFSCRSIYWIDLL
jgi:hypothetical protein